MPDKMQSLEMMRREDGTRGESIKLPEKEKMLERLVERVGNEPHLQQRLYPLLLRKCGLIMTAEGIVASVASALGEYAATNPSPDTDSPIISVNKIIEAMTPGANDDKRIEKIRERAQEAWRWTYVERDRKSEQQ